MTDSDVLISGAGPVGLTPAIDLAWRGIDVMVVKTAALEAAARKRNVPLKVLDIAGSTTASFQGGGLVLSRPDQHVAWRGDGLPADPLALIDHVRGAAKQAC